MDGLGRKEIAKFFIDGLDLDEEEANNVRKRAKQKECMNCKKEQSNMFVCSACQHVYYCSAECQTEDWKLHKSFCNIRSSDEVSDIAMLERQADGTFTMPDGTAIPAEMIQAVLSFAEIDAILKKRQNGNTVKWVFAPPDPSMPPDCATVLGAPEGIKSMRGHSGCIADFFVYLPQPIYDVLCSGTHVQLQHNAIVVELNPELEKAGRFRWAGCPLTPMSCDEPPKVASGADWKSRRYINLYTEDGVMMTSPDELAERIAKQLGLELLGFGRENLALAVRAHGRSKYDKAATVVVMVLYDIKGRPHMREVKVRPKNKEGIKRILDLKRQKKQ